MTSHVCRDGFGGALIHAQVGALNTWVCAICQQSGSDQACQIGAPHADATGECRACGRFTCDRHRSRRGRLCDRCQTLTRNTVLAPGRGPRFGRWGRTGGLHE